MDRAFVLRSSIPGRVRFEIPAMRSNPALAKALESALGGVQPITGVNANAVSGTLLLTFDPEVHLSAIEAEVRSHLEMLEPVEEWESLQSRSPLNRVLGLALPGLTEVGRPLLLTTAAHSLNMLQGMAFITSVNVAGGETLGLLRRLGIESVNGQLRTVTAASFVLTVGEVWAQHVRGKSWQRLARSTEERLRVNAFAHLEQQDLDFFDQYGTGKLLN
ncbi:MAG: hypothetical protein M3144_00205, partial [Actinomycetota bacterium]|nr:hypothetical protein [Actinomycetota bacterium]